MAAVRHSITGLPTDVISPLSPFDGQCVWLSDTKEGWVAAVITAVAGVEIKLKIYSGEEVIVPSHAYESLGNEDGFEQLTSSERRRLTVGRRRNSIASKRGKRILPREVGSAGRKGYEDMDNMPYLHEASVLNNLKHRFQMNEIYTSTGPILIAMNPFTWLDIYDQPVVDKYHKAVDLNLLPPHCYKMAETVFRTMVEEGKNKSIIVCGESGAGKTETTKLVLHYFSLIAGGEVFDHSIEKRVMDSNPLLEAFGNAKTVRNNNSSRFGKYIQIFFGDKDYLLKSGSVTRFLLEKSRSTSQPDLERNFHIFYQLCHGADDDIRSTLKLGDAGDYFYLNQTGCLEADNIDDVHDFNVTRQAMSSLGLTLSQQLAVFKLIAGHLHLGNVQFRDDEDGIAMLMDDGPLVTACEMYGIDVDLLHEAICTKTIFPPGAEPVTTHLSSEQSERQKDAFAKMSYKTLFDWLIDRVNVSLDGAIPFSSSENCTSVGILDIYGFESLLENGFEQLFINYANEKLQSLFNKVIFDGEKALYAAEGISWDPSDFPSNAPCLELIEAKNSGILAMLDEECLLGQGNDLSFCRKITALFGNANPHPSFSECGPSTPWKDPLTNRSTTEKHFVVRHFAGNILYTATNFVEKNQDTLGEALLAVGKFSTNSILKSYFEESVRTSPNQPKTSQPIKRSHSLHTTVGRQFKDQLRKMMETIQGSKPAFLRCIKSNNFLREKVCDSTSVLRQLKSNGVLPALDMRRSGFPSRMQYHEFCREYYVLRTGTNMRPKAGDAKGWRSVAQSIMANKHVLEAHLHESCQYGSSRIFFRNGITAALNGIKERVIKNRVVTMQAYFRAFTQRRRFHKVVRSVLICQTVFRGYSTRKHTQKMFEDIKRRAAIQVVENKLEKMVVDMDSVALVSSDAAVDRVSTVSQLFSEAKAQLDRTRYTLSRASVLENDRSGIKQAQDELAATSDSVEAFSSAVHAAIQAKERTSAARDDAAKDLLKVKMQYSDLLATRDALFSSDHGNRRLGKKSDEISTVVNTAGKKIRGAEEILATDNVSAYTGSVRSAKAAVAAAVNLVDEEKELFAKLKQARSNAQAALSELVDRMSVSMTLADDQELWGSATVQASMDDAQHAIDNAELVISSSESSTVFVECVKSVEHKVEIAHAAVATEGERRGAEIAEINRAKEMLENCSTKLEKIAQTINGAGISDLHVVKSSKEVAEDAVATARQCSASSSVKSFVAAVELAESETKKTEQIVEREKVKKIKLDADRRNGEANLEPAIERFASVCAAVDVSSMGSIPDVEECIELARKAINLAVGAIEAGDVSQIHTSVADAIRRVGIAADEVTRVKDVLSQVESQRQAAILTLEPFQKQLSSAVATVDVASLDDSPAIRNALLLASKAVEDADCLLQKKELSLSDRFNSVVSAAIEKVQEAVKVVSEEKSKRDGWTRQKRTLTNNLEPLIADSTTLSQLVVFGNVHDVPRVHEAMEAVDKSMRYAKNLLQGSDPDSGVVAVAAIDDVKEKLISARGIIEMEQKRKAAADLELDEARKRVAPVVELLAQVQCTIDAHNLGELDAVAETLDSAKRAVNAANRALKLKEPASVSASVAIAVQKSNEVHELVKEEMTRIDRLKREQRSARDIFVEMEHAYSSALVRSQIGKIEGAREVAEAQTAAVELLAKATVLFGNGVASPQLYDRPSTDNCTEIVRELTIAVSSFDTAVTQEIASKKEADRLYRLQLEEERKREAIEAKELRLKEEEAANMRVWAQGMVDPAMKKLATLKATIELQGVANVSFIQEKLRDATDAVKNAQSQLLNNAESSVTTTAVQGAVQMVDHLEQALSTVRAEKSMFNVNERKKQLHQTRLMGAIRTFEEHKEFLQTASFNDNDSVLNAISAAEAALQDAQVMCRSTRFDYTEKGYAEQYAPVEKIDAKVRSATSLIELAIKTAQREHQIYQDKAMLRRKLARDKGLLEDATVKFDFLQQKLGALNARFQIKSIQNLFADKDHVADSLQAADAAVACAKSRLEDHEDDPAGVAASVTLALRRVKEASESMESEETRLLVLQRRHHENTEKKKAHRSQYKEKILSYIKSSKSTTELFNRLDNTPSAAKSIVTKASSPSRGGYFTSRRQQLGGVKPGESIASLKKRPAYRLKMTPAMMSLLPEHVAKRLRGENRNATSDTDLENDESSEIQNKNANPENEQEGKEQDKDSASPSVTLTSPEKVPGTEPSLREIESKLKERIKLLSSRNKEIKIPPPPATPPLPSKDPPVAFIPPQEPSVIGDGAAIVEEMGRSRSMEIKSQVLNNGEADARYDDADIEFEEEGDEEDDEEAADLRSSRATTPYAASPIRSPSPSPSVPDAPRIDEQAKERILSLLAGVIHKKKSLFGRVIESSRVAFRRFDRKGNGLIYTSQFEQALDSCDMGLSASQRRSLLGAIATRSDDLIEYEIFCRALHLKRSAMLRGMTAEERFRNLGKKNKPTKRTTYGKTTIRSKTKANDWRQSLRGAEDTRASARRGTYYGTYDHTEASQLRSTHRTRSTIDAPSISGEQFTGANHSYETNRAKELAKKARDLGNSVGWKKF